MKAIFFLLFFSFTAWANPVCDSKRFTLIADEGANKIVLLDKGHATNLQGPDLYHRDLKKTSLYRSTFLTDDVMELPVYSAFHKPGSDEFTLNYITPENKGSCVIQSVDGANMQAQESHE